MIPEEELKQLRQKHKERWQEIFDSMSLKNLIIYALQETECLALREKKYVLLSVLEALRRLKTDEATRIFSTNGDN